MLCAGVPSGAVDACQVGARQPYQYHHREVYRHFQARCSVTGVKITTIATHNSESQKMYALNYRGKTSSLNLICHENINF